MRNKILPVFLRNVFCVHVHLNLLKDCLSECSQLKRTTQTSSYISGSTILTHVFENRDPYRTYCTNLKVWTPNYIMAGFLAQSAGFLAQSAGFFAKSAGFLAQSAGFLAQSAGFLSQSAGFLVQSAGFLAQSAGFLSQSAGFLAQSAGFLAQSAGFLAQSAGFLARGKTCLSCPWYSSQPHLPSHFLFFVSLVVVFR
jgi:hypothetical protein